MTIAIRLNPDDQSITFDALDSQDSCFINFNLKYQDISCSPQELDQFESYTDLTEEEFWLVLEEIKKYILRKRGQDDRES